MQTTYIIVATILGLLEILALIFGFFKFFNKVTSQLAVVAERVKGLTDRVTTIEAEYKPNGGSSMRDAINRIEAKFNKLEGRFEQHVEESDL